MPIGVLVFAPTVHLPIFELPSVAVPVAEINRTLAVALSLCKLPTVFVLNSLFIACPVLEIVLEVSFVQVVLAADFANPVKAPTVVEPGVPFA